MTTKLRPTMRSTPRRHREMPSLSVPVQPAALAVVHPSPKELARLHDRYYSALWRGDDVSVVTDWLAAHWAASGPPEPCRTPDAVSLYGGTGGGRGIRWYRFPSSILGYLPGEHRAVYWVKVIEALPRSRGLRHGGEC